MKKDITRKTSTTSTTRKTATTKKEETKMTNNNIFTAKPIMLFCAHKSSTTSDPLPHDKYYTDKDHTTFHTIEDRMTAQTIQTLDTQIIFQDELGKFYILSALLPKETVIIDSYHHEFRVTKNYLRDFIVTPMCKQAHALDTTKSNFEILNQAIDLKLDFTLEEYTFTSNNKDYVGYRIYNQQ